MNNQLDTTGTASAVETPNLTSLSDAAFAFAQDASLEKANSWPSISKAVIIIRNIQLSKHRWGLTEKQMAFATKLHKECVEKLANHEADSERKAELLAAGVAVPTGRVEVTGVVEKLKVVDTDYGRQTKVIVGLDNGTRVWGTLPNSNGRTEVGSRVTFIGTFVVSHDDPFFGFYSRPAKWSNHSYVPATTAEEKREALAENKALREEIGPDRMELLELGEAPTEHEAMLLQRMASNRNIINGR